MNNKFESMKLENQLCFPFYAISREIIKLYKPLLDPFHLTYTQYITMLVLWEEEKLTFKKLGKSLHLDSGTLTPVLKKLESMELINKYRTPEDDRVVMVELTDQGRKLQEDMSEIPHELGCKMDITMEQYKELKSMLNKLIKKFD